jgi:hypothetical protein
LDRRLGGPQSRSEETITDPKYVHDEIKSILNWGKLAAIRFSSIQNITNTQNYLLYLKFCTDANLGLSLWGKNTD